MSVQSLHLGRSPLPMFGAQTNVCAMPFSAWRRKNDVYSEPTEENSRSQDQHQDRLAGLQMLLKNCRTRCEQLLLERIV
jgi:hypothetical protein